MKQFKGKSLMSVDNLIPRDIRNLFPVIEKLPPLEDLIDPVQIDQYLEKTAGVYRLNLISTEGAIDDLSEILKLDDPNLKGIAWSCLGGIYAFNGNYVKAFPAFNLALDQQVVDDVKSYIFAELSNLLRKLGYLREAISVLESALAMTKNRKLGWRIKTYIGLCYKYEDPQYSLTVLNNCLDYFRKTGDSVRLGNVLRHIGNVFVHLRDFKSAEEAYDEAMSVSVEQSLLQYQIDILNDKGWMFIKKGEYDSARHLFTKLIHKKLTTYQLSLALQNLGHLEYEVGNYREAITDHSQSLQLTTRYELRDMAIEDFYKLGRCHEQLGEPGLAHHFYLNGYREVMKEVDVLRLPILGYRRKLIDAYVVFLTNNQQIPQVNVKEEIFGFAMNRTLGQIRDIFHKSLFSLHLERTKNAPQLCRKLEIDTRTYFLYQKKLGLKRGEVQTRLLGDNPHFAHYLESLFILTWKEANKKFERDLYAYLLERYQHSKKKLAEVLDVSYQQVVQKTK